MYLRKLNFPSQNKERDIMKIKELIKELKNYDDNLDCDFMLVQDYNESLKDIPVKWIGEIDTSMVYSDDPRIEFGLVKIL